MSGTCIVHIATTVTADTALDSHNPEADVQETAYPLVRGCGVALSVHQ